MRPQPKRRRWMRNLGMLACGNGSIGRPCSLGHGPARSSDRACTGPELLTHCGPSHPPPPGNTAPCRRHHLSALVERPAVESRPTRDFLTRYHQPLAYAAVPEAGARVRDQAARAWAGAMGPAKQESSAQATPVTFEVNFCIASCKLQLSCCAKPRGLSGRGGEPRC